MSITVTGRKTTVTPSLKAYVDEKIGRSLEVFEAAAMDAEVVLRVGHNPANPVSHTCEVTLYAKGAVIRVSESADNMYAAIDAASDKVARQLRKYKTRVVDRRGGRGTIKRMAVEEIDAIELPPVEEVGEDDDLLVRDKEIEMEPMTMERALVQIDLLGHDFYVYFDQDEHQVQVVYRRANGGYGVIKPKVVSYKD
ncbi:MAG: ribosome hibernation-promoting factor, HPF/YfiA family [Coriobacteriales bacterium]